MSPEKTRQHIDVDALQRELTVLQVMNYYGQQLPEGFSGSGEQRMRCPCQECKGSTDDRSVSINASDPFKRWKCHREGYGCGAQGNLLTLAYCLKQGAMPPGGKPRGREFFAVAEDLQAIAGGEVRAPVSSETVDSQRTGTREKTAKVLEKEPNVPLGESDNEAAQKLVTLDADLIRGVGEMSPQASAYARRRPFFSEELCQQCRTGYMPSSSRSSLRGKWVYGVMDEQGEPLAWVGRNLKYEDEYKKWVNGNRSGDEPAKYRFPSVKLFRRGLELYGQEWLTDERFEKSLQEHGLIVVEGFGDRIRLHDLDVASVGIMSNRITREQLEKLAQLAMKHARGRVGVMLDADTKGDEGAKDLLWRLQELGLNGYLVWSGNTQQGAFKGREPESIDFNEWSQIAERFKH